MPKRHEQKTHIAEEREAGTTKHGQYDATRPADAVEITDAAADHKREEGEPGPKKAVDRKISGCEARVEAMPYSGKARRPEQGCGDAAADAEGDCVGAAG